MRRRPQKCSEMSGHVTMQSDRAQHREDDSTSGSSAASRRSGSPRTSRFRAKKLRQYIDAYLAPASRWCRTSIQRTIEQAAEDGYVTTLFGRRRPVPEIRASNRQTRSLGERLAVNSVMQGTAADIIKVAMVSIHDRLRDEGRASRLVLQIHDELLRRGPGCRSVDRGMTSCARRCQAAYLPRSRASWPSTSAAATIGTRRSKATARPAVNSESAQRPSRAPLRSSAVPTRAAPQARRSSCVAVPRDRQRGPAI